MVLSETLYILTFSAVPSFQITLTNEARNKLMEPYSLMGVRRNLHFEKYPEGRGNEVGLAANEI